MDQVADLLAVEPITVRRLIASGALQAQRVGRAVRVFTDSLEAYQRASVIAPAAQRAGAAKRVRRAHLDAMQALNALGIK